jgi:hypothetical protein
MSDDFDAVLISPPPFVVLLYLILFGNLEKVEKPKSYTFLKHLPFLEATRIRKKLQILQIHVSMTVTLNYQFSSKARKHPSISTVHSTLTRFSFISNILRK